MNTKLRILQRKRRHLRVRKRVKGTEERPRLCVHKSSKHTYAQLIVDPPLSACKVITGASSLSPEIKKKNIKKTEKAKEVGKLIAKRAKKLGIKKVSFDRAGYPYHGRIKTLAEGAREEGLEF